MGDRYKIREVFLTLQGEGARAGTKAVFVRFSGCNLWNGREQDRAKGTGPCAAWCDTDFFGGSMMTAETLLEEMGKLWPAGERWCVLTGGEPALQFDQPLRVALVQGGWHIAVESNGTIANPAIDDCDHVCLSPKRGTSWRHLDCVSEIKVVLPGGPNDGSGWSTDELRAMRDVYPDAALFVQPQDGLLRKRHERACLEWVLANPEWRLSTQQHKALGLR